MKNGSKRWVGKSATVMVFSACTSCASLSTLDTPFQRQMTSLTTRAVLGSRVAAREAADNSPASGVLVFIDPTTKQLKTLLPGDSPTDAWLRFAATSRATKTDDLPFPSSVSPTAVYIPKGTRAGKSRLIYTVDLDAQVKERYDLSSAILQLSAAVQQMRDITILLSISDKNQNDALKKLDADFARLGQSVGSLTVKLQQLSREENDDNAALSQQLRQLSTQLDSLQNQISRLK